MGWNRKVPPTYLRIPGGGRCDVRFWPKAGVLALNNAVKNARVRYRTEADVRLLQTCATPDGPVVQLPGVLGSQ